MLKNLIKPIGFLVLTIVGIVSLCGVSIPVNPGDPTTTIFIGGIPQVGYGIVATSGTTAEWRGRSDVWCISLSDTTTPLTTGNTKESFRVPASCLLYDIRMEVGTASSSGLPTVDIKQNGATILSTKVSIDANEKTSTAATTQPVISTQWLTDDAELTFNQDVAGTGTVREKLKLYVIYGPSPSPTP